jgi:hypothetical protein
MDVTSLKKQEKAPAQGTFKQPEKEQPEIERLLATSPYKRLQ